MKLNIMKSKPDITDEEIRNYMNFDGLMKEFKAAPKKPSIPTPLKVVSLAGGIIIIAVVSYFLGLKNQDQSEESQKTKSNSEISFPSQKTDIQPVEKDSTVEILQTENANLKKEVVVKDPTPTPSKKITEENSQTKATERKSDSAKALPTSGYLQAEPLNGFPHLYEYFGSELKYPEEAVKDSIQGIVTVSFIVTKEGKPEKITVLNSLGAVFDKEVVRLIENMPAWKPASMNGTPVPSKISMPLTFRLERIKK